MICELLNDGIVNATLSVIFEDEEYQYEVCESTALHWACMNGYLDVVQLLLKYDNVDVCCRDNHCNESIHYAAEFGHNESYSF
jgi:hypothetical protein